MDFPDIVLAILSFFNYLHNILHMAMNNAKPVIVIYLNWSWNSAVNVSLLLLSKSISETEFILSDQSREVRTLFSYIN